eukprot:TRINITY_DN10514_c0_g1_i2.p1 TRINITY_DN10514_c0_g1~~TRINITY_DN10514_c0_g1_i2.p1  ORF type:complete len:648 (-),score=163.56 TRINITY_DN10514_c0_g1_i2:90-2033(-)
MSEDQQHDDLGKPLLQHEEVELPAKTVAPETASGALPDSWYDVADAVTLHPRATECMDRMKLGFLCGPLGNLIPYQETFDYMQYRDSELSGHPQNDGAKRMVGVMDYPFCAGGPFCQDRRLTITGDGSGHPLYTLVWNEDKPIVKKIFSCLSHTPEITIHEGEHSGPKIGFVQTDPNVMCCYVCPPTVYFCDWTYSVAGLGPDRETVHYARWNPPNCVKTCDTAFKCNCPHCHCWDCNITCPHCNFSCPDCQFPKCECPPHCPPGWCPYIHFTSRGRKAHKRKKVDLDLDHIEPPKLPSNFGPCNPIIKPCLHCCGKVRTLPGHCLRCVKGLPNFCMTKCNPILCYGLLEPPGLLICMDNVQPLLTCFGIVPPPPQVAGTTCAALGCCMAACTGFGTIEMAHDAGAFAMLCAPCVCSLDYLGCDCTDLFSCNLVNLYQKAKHAFINLMKTVSKLCLKVPLCGQSCSVIVDPHHECPHCAHNCFLDPHAAIASGSGLGDMMGAAGLPKDGVHGQSMGEPAEDPRRVTFDHGEWLQGQPPGMRNEKLAEKRGLPYSPVVTTSWYEGYKTPCLPHNCCCPVYTGGKAGYTYRFDLPRGAPASDRIIMLGLAHWFHDRRHIMQVHTTRIGATWDFLAGEQDPRAPVVTDMY